MNIDRIAREMVDVEPSADLEARIRGRLNEAQPNRTAPWWLWRVGAPLAAATALGLAAISFAVQGPGSRVQSPGSRVQSPGSRVQSPGSRVQSPISTVQSQAAATSLLAEVRSSPVPHLPSSPVPKVPTSKLSSEELAWMERRMPALDAVSALQVDHLRVDSIQPEPLSITPLTMAPIGTEGAAIERRNDR